MSESKSGAQTANHSSVLIVGAGYTGLMAARKLLQAGKTVTILEAAPHIGGLAADFQMNGEPLERAYHHFFTTDVFLIQLLKDLGLEERIQWHRSSMAIVRGGRVWPFNGPVDLLKFQPLAFFNRIRAGLVVLFLQKYTNWRSLIRVPAADWMRRFSGSQVYDVIWKPLLIGKFGQQFQNVSMAWLWARIHIRAKSRQGDHEVLGYPNGGFNQITSALAGGIHAAGGQILTGRQVRGLTKVGEGYSVQTNQDETFTADQVLLTTPSDISAKILEGLAAPELDPYIANLRSISYLGAICMIFSSPQSLSRFYWHNINDPDSPFLAFIEHTNLIPKERYGDQHVYYVANYLPATHEYFTMEPDALRALWLGHLKKLFPEFDQSQIQNFQLFRFAKAQHIVTTTYEDTLVPFQTPLPGLFVSNFAQIFPEDRGTNFAVRDGARVAAEMLKGAAQTPGM
jgi:protoporphyrinogen oxidase